MDQTCDRRARLNSEARLNAEARAMNRERWRTKNEVWHGCRTTSLRLADKQTRDNNKHVNAFLGHFPRH